MNLAFYQTNLTKSNQSSTEYNTTIENLSYDSSYTDNFKHVRIDESQDLDNNKFQDSFEQTLKELNREKPVDAILSLSHELTDADRYFLQKRNVEIIDEYTMIYALHVRGVPSSLLQINTLDNALFVEEDSKGYSLMYNVTTTSGVRTVWQDAQGYGYTGDSNTAIAILDTGIDDSHLDSNLNVVYWQDFEGADSSVGGDEYVTPTDKAEHGTHCASIAASAGTQIDNGTFKIQDSGFLHTTEGWAYYGTWFYIETAQTVTLNYTWEDGGVPYVGIVDGTGSWVADNYGSGSSSSPASFQVYLSSPGWYCPMWGNDNGAGDHYYSAEFTYESGWTNPYSDGRGAFAGVAPDSNIVGLKVLDDSGTGYASALLNAIQWLYDFGQNYNVTVASMSIGWQSVVSVIDSAITSLVRNKGIVCVVAAGNAGTSSGGIYSPASCPDVIAVGSVNKAYEIAYYSSVGSIGDAYKRPDVVAPGGSYAYYGTSAPNQPIIAADSNDGDDAYNYNNFTAMPPQTDYYQNNFRGMQGTLMACPFVAGLAQLVIDAMREEGTWEYSWEVAKKVKQIICMGTFEVRNIEGDIASGGETFDGDGDAIPQNPVLDRTTKDYTEGWGCVSPVAAIQAVTEWLSVDISETISLSGQQNGSHVEVRQVELKTKNLYIMLGNYSVSTWIDADLLLFDADPDQYGDPILIASNTLGVVMNDSTVFSVGKDGTYYLVIRWVDGNLNGNCTIKIEEMIQSVSHEDGDILKPGDTITFNLTYTNLASIMYKWDFGSSVLWNYPYEVFLPDFDFDHVLIIYGIDYQAREAQVNYTFLGDSIKPEIVLISPVNNTVVGVSELVQLSISDTNLEVVLYNWDASIDDIWIEPYETTVPSEEGEHILYVYAEDVAGNWERIICVFEIPPTVPEFGLVSILSIIGLLAIASAVIFTKRK